MSEAKDYGAICFNCKHGEWTTETSDYMTFYEYNCVHPKHPEKDIDPGMEACSDYEPREDK